MSESLHILGPQFSSFVRSVQLCCEEKGIPYTLGMSLDGEPVELGTPRHLALHPFGKIPVLLHGSRHLYETTTICRYLDAAFDGPALQPTEPWARARIDQLSAALALYVDQAVVRRFLLEFAFPKGEDGSIRWDRVEAAKPEVGRMLGWLEGELGERDYLGGEAFTIADAIAAPMLDYLAELPGMEEAMAERPHLRAYLGRLRERESGRRVLGAPRKE